MLAQMFPFLSWLKTYDRKKCIADLSAGLTVAVILVPQAMAYAMLAGLPPVYGLYAGLVGAGIASLFGSSTQLSTGPVAIVSFLVLTSLTPFAVPESETFIGYAILLALLVGLIQLLMGVFRLGFMMSFVSHAVIVGFTNAAALIIASTQIPSFLGIKVGQHELVFETFADIAKNLPSTHLPSLTISVLSIAAILILRRIHTAFPAALIVVVISILASSYFGFEALGIKVVGSVPSGIPFPALPTLSLDMMSDLLGTALIISIIGFMEAFAIAKSLAAKMKEKLDVNQELIGQGLANITVSLFRGYPVSGSFSRSAVNNLAGAKTGMAGIFVSLFVLLALLFVAPYLYALPKAVLAAIVIVAVAGLVDIRQLNTLWKTSRSDGAVAIATFAFAFLMKPDYAIFIGIILSLMLFLRKTMRPDLAILGRDEERHAFADIKDDPAARCCPYITLVRPDRALYFANIDTIIESAEKIISEHKPRVFIVDGEAINFIDATAIEMLKYFIHEKEAAGLHILFINLKEDVRATFRRAGMDDFLKKNASIMGKSEAIQYGKSLLPAECCTTCTARIFQECK
jgi:SulP family sulfate permease